MRALLVDPNAAWDRPALTTHGRNNHALRSQDYRYIRYADGGEELYDHKIDPHEWHNLASNSEHRATKQQLARWLPEQWAPTALTKSAFEFDPHTFTWKHKQTGELTIGNR